MTLACRQLYPRLEKKQIVDKIKAAFVIDNLISLSLEKEPYFALRTIFFLKVYYQLLASQTDVFVFDNFLRLTTKY